MVSASYNATPSGPNTTSSNGVLRKLHTLEPVIVEMLTLGRATSILKAKLYQVESLVWDIPDIREPDVRVAQEWRSKLACWWKEFAASEKAPSKCTSVAGTSTATSTNSEASSPNTSLLSLSKKSLILDNPFDDQLSKDYLRSQLSSAFEELPDVCSAADLHGMQHLISTIVRAFELVPPTLRDDYLQQSVFEYAYHKLPQQMHDCFEIEYEQPYTLYQLYHFIRLEIESYMDNNKLILPNLSRFVPCNDESQLPEQEKLTIENGGDSNFDDIAEDSDVVNKQRCYSCGTIGHTKEYCPEEANLFCLKCFDYGHPAKRCPGVVSQIQNCKMYKIAIK